MKKLINMFFIGIVMVLVYGCCGCGDSKSKSCDSKCTKYNISQNKSGYVIHRGVWYSVKVKD